MDPERVGGRAVGSVAAVSRAVRWSAGATCVALVVAHACLAYTAVRTKSATYDEPMHALGAWVRLHQRDFRINIEDPPLWQYWAALPNRSGALAVDWNRSDWRRMAADPYAQWSFVLQTLYDTPENDGAAFLHRSRSVMLAFGVALCGVVAAWAWRIAGPAAAVVATWLVSFDPNFIGHGPLVKNDVAMALAMIAVMFATWRVGQRATVLRVLALAVLVAAAVNIKFSANAIPVIVAVLLVGRALAGAPWVVGGRTVTSRLARVGAATGMVAAVGALSYLAIWACYDFRFRPSDDRSVRLDPVVLKQRLMEARYRVDRAGMTPVRLPGRPTAPVAIVDAFDHQAARMSALIDELTRALPSARLAAEERHAMQRFVGEAAPLVTRASAIGSAARPLMAGTQGADARTLTGGQAGVGEEITTLSRELHALEERAQVFLHWISVGAGGGDPVVRAIDTLFGWQLLPSAWLHGVLYVYANSIERGTYLLGHAGSTGRWYYFPLAMLFKTPVATLAVLAFSTLWGVAMLATSRRHTHAPAGGVPSWWLAVCLLAPAGLYMLSAMSANLNLGLRHVLCVYPFAYVGAAVPVGRALMQWPRAAGLVCSMAAMALAVETLTTWPHYLAYFNVAAGGSRGGLERLGDSNLDWGQDLPLLRQWQIEHDGRPIALAYFGANDGPGPSVVLPRYYGIDFVPLPPGAPDPRLTDRLVVAVSATHLQGIYSNEYVAYRAKAPIEVLGGTIYLYDLRPK